MVNNLNEHMSVHLRKYDDFKERLDGPYETQGIWPNLVDLVIVDHDVVLLEVWTHPQGR